jgi:hypothetical protein
MSPITYGRDFEPRFRPFLQTSLWEERGDAPVSLLSALARLDLDPWQEAAALAQLPPAAAAQRLSGLLQGSPTLPLSAELAAICQRAVDLLPGPEATPQVAPRDWAQQPARVFLMDAVLVACFLTTLVLMSNFSLRARAASEPAGATGALRTAPITPPAPGR